MRYMKTKISNEFMQDGLSQLLKSHPDMPGYLFSIEEGDDDRGLVTLYLYETKPLYKYAVMVKVDVDEIQFANVKLGEQTDIEDLLNNVIHAEAINTKAVIQRVVDLNSHAVLDKMHFGYDCDDCVSNKYSVRMEFLLPPVE